MQETELTRLETAIRFVLWNQLDVYGIADLQTSVIVDSSSSPAPVASTFFISISVDTGAAAAGSLPPITTRGAEVPKG